MPKITPKLHPKHIDGRFRKLKNGISFVLQIALFLTPWIEIGGKPFIQLDVQGRILHVLGWSFFPDDAYLFAFLIFSAFFGLYFITSLLGRMWCGYACPQTLLSHSFIRVERFFQGDRIKRLKLAKAPWSGEKIRKYLATYAVQLAMSLFLGLTFAGYFYPMSWLTKHFVDFSSPDVGDAWFIILFFTVVSLIFFGFLRERFCHTMCPYARLQGAMFDKDTLVVGYDFNRGEPRGKLKDPNTNDCIDCKVCVDVCPVGIDIRDGLQFECIACAACIDGCDSIMDKIKKPRGLIRYCSEKELEDEETRWSRPRPWIYGALLLVTLGCLMTGLATRPSVRAYLHREVTQSVTQHAKDGRQMNMFELKLTNKSSDTRSFEAVTDTPDVELVLPQNPFTIEGLKRWESPLYMLYSGEKKAGPGDVQIRIIDLADNEVVFELESRFIGGGI